LSKTFKVSNDIRFEEKLTDIVGLYMNPPERQKFDTFFQKLCIPQPSLPINSSTYDGFQAEAKKCL